ncbi:MAG: ATP-binding cassette domain-containing protein [Candidatus Hydrogenedentes bacterium]|jgi:ABC-2 type transport system ATP-binding protein|nr:ATP-binding cassette domain-containing protein [Candidatus Hydrogenedentota bacterium]
MIEAKGLTKYFGLVGALQNASFTAGKNEVVGFLGPNGAGKSTAMRILTGFFPAGKGTAHIDGIEVHENPLEVKRKIGYMPEHVPLYDDMTVRGFLNFAATVKGLRKKQRNEEVERVMAHCGLEPMIRRMLRNLSKGYRQRVGLAQALLGSPPVLILDEPTAGLDPAQIVEIRNLIKALGKEHTVLLSTHILPEVNMVCDRVIIINRGHIVAQESMDRFTASGQRSLEEAFMTAVSTDSIVGEVRS